MARKELAIEHVLAAAVAPNETFDVDYPSGYAQADFVDSDARTSVMGASHDDLPVTLGGSAATITWPTAKATTLPAGTKLTIGLELVKTVDFERMQNVLPNQADSAGGDVATITADFNTLLASLKSSGLMAPD